MTFESSEQFNDLAAALAAAQLNMGGAKKTSANPHFKSKYADLSEVWDACHAALNSNGIAVVQTPVPGDGELGIRTLLVHSGGQWMACTVMIPVAKSDAHGIGSALTYARRYGLSAMVGVCPEDDDGNGAAKSVDARDKLRTDTLPGLQAAAMNGMQALSTAWSQLTREQQAACKADKDTLKKAATEADKHHAIEEDAYASAGA
jgi:hypothetical protein